ncbi:ScbA/BarX family gamma-butyrolactone biosynthesis protein [Streptomyces sp. S.PB5]|uniref:ScbA/BarX family gamma-butyrolactone biosynthesis protein n=1 Tax=Streptomyces sp. S.PB5 TaxID=3020844 RepID=UPI0025AFD3DC|nr:ScbA/BarX family gamma-butyrolactone biosynthesis protein [Streptomyces sp. S.PB5]MDN3027293.1 ScbA/BarX family gamma-butyrolactone biosynthesis protein [Streptomyces sp. S.PB5]
MRYASLTTTVPKELVHRASVSEVMLTDWEREADDHFVLTGQWPRRHGFFTTVDDCHDPLIVAETIRQAGILLAHAEYGVPLDHRFLMWDLAVEVKPQHMLVGTAPASLHIEITCKDVKRRRGDLSGLRYEALIFRNGQLAATGGARFTCLSPAVYQRVRAPRPESGSRNPLPLTAPLAPQDVDRLSPTDVVLSPTGEPDQWQLRVDTRHPVLFDHPVDHTPGMLLLEAARQAMVAHLGRPCLPRSVTAEFMRYSELDAPCLIKANPVPVPGSGHEERVLMTGHQEGSLVFQALVTVASPIA